MKLLFSKADNDTQLQTKEYWIHNKSVLFNKVDIQVGFYDQFVLYFQLSPSTLSIL